MLVATQWSLDIRDIRTESILAKQGNLTMIVSLGVAATLTSCQNFILLATLSALSANAAKNKIT